MDLSFLNLSLVTRGTPCYLKEFYSKYVNSTCNRGQTESKHACNSKVTIVYELHTLKFLLYITCVSLRKKAIHMMPAMITCICVSVYDGIINIPNLY